MQKVFKGEEGDRSRKMNSPGRLFLTSNLSRITRNFKACDHCAGFEIYALFYSIKAADATQHFDLPAF